MRILLIESGQIELEWLQHYMQVYDSSVEVIGAKSMAEANEILKSQDGIDIILLDVKVHDILSPSGISGVVFSAPNVPIVILVTGKVMHYECSRTPMTRLYHLKTDVSTGAFLQHLRNIVAETENELRRVSSGEYKG